MTKIPSVVEVVEAIRQRHIHLKANNPVGFVHLFADIKKALTAQRDAGAEEERERARKVIEKRLKYSELMLRELSGGNDMQGGDIDDQIDHETSAKVVLEGLLLALTPPTK